MCDPILVTPLKMRPHDSQSSRENATPSSGTSPLASYKEVHPPPGSTYFMHQSFQSPAPPYSGLSGGWGGGGFHFRYTPCWFPGRRGIRWKSRSSHPLRGNKRGSHQTSALFVLKPFNCSHFAKRFNHYSK